MNMSSILSPPVFDDPERNRQAKLLHGILGFIAISVTGLLVMVLIAVPGYLLRAVIIMGSITLACTICFVMIYRGLIRTAGFLFLCLFWMIVTWLSVTAGGAEAPAFIGFLIVVLCAGLLLNLRSALVAAAICLATEVVIIYAELNSVLPPSTVQHSVYSLSIIHTFFFVLVIVFVYFYTTGIEGAYRQASQDLAERNRVEVENRKTLLELGERVKELTAIHGTINILQRTGIELQEIMNSVATILPQAFQYPEVTAARVCWGPVEGTTPGFDESLSLLRSEFKTADGQQGAVEVVCTQERPQAYEGPFLREERAMLNTIADMLRTSLDRKRAEEAVQASERRFRSLIEKAPTAVSISRDRKRIYANRKYVEMFGFQTAEELIGQPIGDRWATKDRKMIEERSQQRLGGLQGPSTIEATAQRKDGSQFPVLIAATDVDLPDGPAVLGFVTDITDRKQAEEALKASEEKYRGFIESARDAIYTLSPDRIITSLNSAFERITGFKSEEWVGKSFDDIVYPADLPRAHENFNRHLEGRETPLYELRIKKQSGDYATGEFLTIPQMKAGKFAGVLGIARDVTERKTLEEQLRRTQRLDSIGTLAGGIAHDLNNVLAPILLSAEVLERRISEEDAKRMLGSIRKSAKRGSEIVKQVLTFARGTEQEYKPQQLRYVVKEIEAFVKDSFPKNIELRSDIPKDLPLILGDQTQLHQVLLNLCVNGRDAMPNGGRLTISAVNATLSKGDLKGQHDVSPGEFVALSVSDTGTGIPPEIQSKIFEPFFTTKEIGKGTGLGLSTVFSIVRDHKGFIRLQSEQGKGTEFKVFIPSVTEKKADVEKEQKAALPRGNGEHILVVEDEQTLLQITRETLEAYGYTVFTALDGVEAATLFMSEPKGSIPIVFSDVDMPRMSGLDMSKLILQHDQGVEILITSGASSGTSVVTARARAKTFLPKPYTTEQLLQAIYRLLHKDVNKS